MAYIAAKLMLPWAYWNVSCWVLRAEIGNHMCIQGVAGAQSVHVKKQKGDW